MTQSDLVIVETMFCDNEHDQDILRTYFERFKTTLRSVLAQQLSDDIELLFTIYMSSDKRRWIDHSWSIIDNSELPSNMKVRIWEYQHPNGGYPPAQGVDRMKSPNKHAPQRDRLFQVAHSFIDFPSYRSVIRVAIDDDDLWLKNHVSELHRVARQGHLSHPEAEILALGPVNCMIGYVSNDGVDVDIVSMRRTLTGDKLYSLEHATVGTISTLSPWGIPEILDESMAQRLLERGITLRYVKGNAPGFIYLRWGQNLSNYRKDYHVAETYGSFKVESVESLLSYPNQNILTSQEPVEFGTFGKKLEVRASRSSEGTVQYTTNFESLNLADSQICFYLLQGGKRIDVKAYSNRGAGAFTNAPKGVNVKAFVRNNDGIYLRAETDSI